MKFSSFNKLGGLFKEVDKSFNNIDGYYDIKEIVKRALSSEDQYNLMFIDEPASGKTLFLQGIMEICKETCRSLYRFESRLNLWRIQRDSTSPVYEPVHTALAVVF